MSKLPIVDAQTMQRILVRLGFVAVRRKDSRIFYEHPDGRTTTLPHYGGRNLGRPLIRESLHEIELSPEEFETELRK